jgi:hypothetical protein
VPGGLEDFFPFREWGLTVEYGVVPRTLDVVTRTGDQFQAGPSEVLVDMGQHGRMLVQRDHIVLDVPPGLDLGAIDFYLYGFVPRVVRILREEYSLHASAVVAGGVAVAVMGMSRAGKSTTTMGLVQRGCPLIVDDVLPVDVRDDAVTVHGWDRPLHLREEAAARLGVAPATRREQPGGTKVRTRPGGRGEAVPLGVIVELTIDETSADVRTTWLSGAQRLAVVIEHSDVAQLASADGRQASFFHWAADVADRVPIARVTRPSAGWTLESVVDAVVAIGEEVGEAASGHSGAGRPRRPGPRRGSWR